MVFEIISQANALKIDVMSDKWKFMGLLKQFWIQYCTSNGTFKGWNQLKIYSEILIEKIGIQQKTQILRENSAYEPSTNKLCSFLCGLSSTRNKKFS